uniref:Uncharacterized protein n=1 Tax=Opuntia streptacantha TaxID=393608 RepID=A0A7C9DAN7_OPUST
MPPNFLNCAPSTIQRFNVEINANNARIISGLDKILTNLRERQPIYEPTLQLIRYLSSQFDGQDTALLDPLPRQGNSHSTFNDKFLPRIKLLELELAGRVFLSLLRGAIIRVLVFFKLELQRLRIGIERAEREIPARVGGGWAVKRSD